MIVVLEMAIDGAGEQALERGPAEQPPGDVAEPHHEAALERRR